MRKRERELWRQRSQRLDGIFLRLRHDGPATPRTLASELGYDLDDVHELLNDLHIDNIVTRCGDIYRENFDDWTLQ